MKNKFLIITIFTTTTLFAQNSYSPNFKLTVTKKEKTEIIRTAAFLPTLIEPSKKLIERMDPGKSGHLTLLLKDEMSIVGKDDSLETKLNTPGSFVYIFENTDLLDSTRFLTIISDSSTVTHFLAQIKKVRRREWELFRIIIQPRFFNRTKETSWAVYLRFQNDIFTVNLPNKSNRQTMRMRAISPAIPIIHLGNIDYTQYEVGPGLSFNIGLCPRRPMVRLVADIVGPVSIEWMFHPISGIDDILAIHSSAVGLFFNSGYGILHWGIAFYTATFSRAEAYIGINLVPVMSLLQTRGKQRYRW